jgi:hypothetical protein
MADWEVVLYPLKIVKGVHLLEKNAGFIHTPLVLSYQLGTYTGSDPWLYNFSIK